MGTIFEFVNKLKRKPFIQSIMNDLHGEAFLVGGATRDLLLGKQNKDVDLVVRGVNIDILLNQLRKFGSANIVGKSFGVITFKDNSDGEIYDVALPRTEFANGDGGHKGFDITYDENLPIEKDLIRRDAKFNAIAINLNTNQIIDPHGGLDDIKNKQTSLVNPDAFTDDPLRLLRFVGFTARNAGFKIAPESMSKIHQTAHRIKEISSERILKEFEKIVEKGSPESGAKLLVETTLYQNIFGTKFNGSFVQFGKVKTLAEFMFLLMNGSITNPAQFYIQHFGDYGSLSKQLKAFELTRKEINTPAEERWLMNTVNKIDPKAVGSFVVQDKLKDASIHPEERYPRKAADLAVTGSEIDAMGITGGQHGQLNTDLLNLIYGDQLENTHDSIMGYIQQNFDKYKSTPQRIREITTKILTGDINEDAVSDINFNKEAKKIYNKIINNIQTVKLTPTSNNDFVVDTKGVSRKLNGVKFNINQLCGEYDLDILLVNQMGHNVAHYDRSNNRLVFFIISQVKDPNDFEHNSYLARLRFSSWVDELAFTHEFTHFLDNKRYTDTYSFSTPENSTFYYNSPEEYNSYTQEIINQILKNKNKLKGVTFDKFLYTVLKYANEIFIKNLSDDYKKKLNNRLYKLYVQINKPDTPQKIREITTKILSEKELEEITGYRGGKLKDPPYYMTTDKKYARQFYDELKLDNLDAKLHKFDVEVGRVLDLTGDFSHSIKPSATIAVFEKHGVQFTDEEKYKITELERLGSAYGNYALFTQIVTNEEFANAALRAGYDSIKQKEYYTDGKLYDSYFILRHNKPLERVKQLKEETLNESEGNMDGNFEALVQQVKQRVPSLAKYNEFLEKNYDHFQLSKRIGQADVYWHNQQVTLTNVAIMSEFKMSYRNFNEKKWYNFTLKNQIFFDIPDTFGSDMERFVMQTAFNMLNDKYSYHKELMAPETSTYQQADIDEIVNEINRKTFEFEDHVNNFTRTEIFEGVRVNGRELSKLEELELLKRDAAEKRLIVKTGDYRDGANALHSLSIINSRIRMITLELKIEELSKMQDNERNAQRYDKFDKQIKKLRNELDQLKYPELLKEGYEMRGAWFIPDASGGRLVETKFHSQYAMKYYGMRDHEAAFKRALEDGWVRIVYPFEGTSWAFNSFSKENLIKALQKLRNEIIYGNSRNIYIDYKDDEWETYSVKDPEFLHKFGLLHETKDIVEKLTRESLTLYHGSPHKFDKFSTEHMGTGEGAQAFGWGLYFTELQDIAHHYASINPDIFNADMAYITKYIYGYNYNSFDTKRVSTMPIPERNKLINQAYEREIATINRMCGGSEKMAQIVYKHSEEEEIRLAAELRDKYINISNTQQRNVYQVTVHKGKTPDQYVWLEWDRIVPPNILAKIRSYISTSKESDYENVDSSYQIRQYMRVMDDPNYAPQTKTGEKLYRELSSYLGEKGASMLLLHCGIDGVKYAAESISHGKTSDTARGFDYVVFDDKAVTLDTHKQLEEKKTKFTKQQLQESIMEAQRSQLKRLVIFDMDSTLINSPMPEFGREEYKQKTGGDFPSEKAWWSVPESLDTNVFEITAIAPVFNQMRDEQRRSDTMVVVMTNRLDTLEREVKRVLRLNRINPDALNMAAYAQQNKGERILQILKENPSIRYVAFYDDQEKNITDVRNALRKKGITYDLYNCQDGKIRRT
jgi:tRNA nucleotidyltransferase/poly(A) polymerase